MDPSLEDIVPTSIENPLVRQFFDRLQLSFLDEFDKDVAQPAITLKKRPSHFQLATHDNDPEERMLSKEVDRSERLITYTWPGRSPYEAWKFTCILRVLSLITEAVQDNLLITKRSIYYDNPGLFGTQAVVNTIVDDIAYTIGVDRAVLHIISVGKGLAVGAVRIRTKSDSMLDLTAEDALIPRLIDVSSVDISEVKWVCVVEKEAADKRQAVFRRLVHNRYHLESAAGKGILITGKGYPDICTREFVHLISDITFRRHNATLQNIDIVPSPTPLRFFALVDGDCDGIAIMSTYKYGSMAHAHASAMLNAPKLQWLGTRIEDVIIKQNGAEVEDEDWVMISLSNRDVKKIRSMLMKNPVFGENGPQLDWRVELQIMMMLNTKVETEVLYGTEGSLEGWLDRKMESLSRSN
ncbi:meiosis-specific topoisomerase Spo11, putative [Talaromyces stipitatus ATCC 10500]|uniref:DNA topoisomerase (ATP-hydrolyzing) n=1 Tax=Talaromyces stipitatus (strain ATCC 10500 / CBS 375.48 / QM 6759 / NRRL 1006) TaxID=441959 RepID=B8M9Q7_TALSN|nr:meiosis-specific topoisomerase Spo11, putative [Talaromyces stipitatus ATCC 10500]EED18059.1 meiosis-specific topoisomerase Spo11, putative [Talaromyces stipitatus ATCC 10500]